VKQGDLTPVVGSLRFAIKDLRAKWDDMKEVWRDDVARRFEENHVRPLDEPTEIAVKAIERLGITLMKAYDACSPDRE
jgi:hypothetical protein